MAKTLIVIGLLGMCCALLHGQSCLPEGITFRSQAEVDSFRKDYPGCTTIEGDVWFDNLGEDILSWDSLDHLQAIRGTLIFQPSALLTTITGFDSLRVIGGDLWMQDQLGVVTFDAFARLDSVGGTLALSGMKPGAAWRPFPRLGAVGESIMIEYTATDTLGGFDALRRVVGALVIQKNDSLRVCSGFDQLHTLGYAVIRLNPSLREFRGLGLVDTISGDLSISSNDSLVNLSAFMALSHVGRNLSVIDNDLLGDLAAFSSLQRVGGTLSIGSNPMLGNLDGLQQLTFVGERVLLENNARLTDISQLSRLDTVLVAMWIRVNPALEHLRYPPELTYVYDVMISDNDSLAAITGLAGHHEIRRLYIHDHDLLRKLVLDGTSLHQVGYLEVGNNPGLDTLSIAPKESWAMSVSIEGNPNLRSIQLQGAHMTGLTLRISNNSALENLQGLDSITVIKLLSITDNPALSSFSGLGGLRSVNDILTVRGNPAIVNFAGMDSLQRVGFGMSVSENASLLNMEGLGSLESVGHTFFITRNPSLVNFQGMDAFREAASLSIQDNPGLVSFEGLNHMQMTGPFELFNNDALVDFTGLDVLRQTGGFHIRGNDRLVSFGGLMALEELDGLEVERNPALTSLDGLTAIEAIHHFLQLTNNPVLEDLQAIGDVYIQTHNFTDVTIRLCPALSVCALPSICYYISNSDRITIDSNALGCNSVEEVELQCLTPLESVPGLDVRLYPNPVTDFLHWSGSGDARLRVDVFNATGRPMGGTDLRYLDVSGWPAGMYQVHIQANGQVIRKAFVKI